MKKLVFANEKLFHLLNLSSKIFIRTHNSWQVYHTATVLCVQLSKRFFKWANPSLFLYIIVIFSIQFQ